MLLWQSIRTSAPESSRAKIPHSFQQKELAKTYPCAVGLWEGKAIPLPSPCPHFALQHVPRSGWLWHRIVSPGLWHHTTETALSDWCQTDRIRRPRKISAHVFAVPSPPCLITVTPDQQNAASRPPSRCALNQQPAQKISSFRRQRAASRDVKLSISNKTGGQIPPPWRPRLKLEPSFHLADILLKEIQKTVLRKIHATYAPKSTTLCF